MSNIETFERLLDRRGTRGYPARFAQHKVDDVDPRIPKEVGDLLRVQDGEDQLRTYSLGFAFAGVGQIQSLLTTLKEMVEVDETLPAEFLDFVPFLSTGLSSDVGIFKATSRVFPGEIVEYHCETGGLIRWTASMAEFLAGLLSGCEPFNQLGKTFPAKGMRVFVIDDWEMCAGGDEG
jgi:hypothetical protein